MAEMRPWTKRIVTDASVEVFGRTGYSRRPKKEIAEELARDLKELFGEHSEWKGVEVLVHTESEVRCVFCDLLYEENQEEEGPLCCDHAMETYRKMKADSELPVHEQFPAGRPSEVA